MDNKTALQIARAIAQELVDLEAKLVILSGSTARGKAEPNDLDICAILPDSTIELFSDVKYYNKYQRELEERHNVSTSLILYSEGDVIQGLIKEYKRDPKYVSFRLAQMCLDSVKNQGLGWPLTWILGEEAREALYPYMMFQEEFIVLHGQEYLEELRRILKE